MWIWYFTEFWHNRPACISVISTQYEYSLSKMGTHLMCRNSGIIFYLYFATSKAIKMKKWNVPFENKIYLNLNRG